MRSLFGKALLCMAAAMFCLAGVGYAVEGNASGSVLDDDKLLEDLFYFNDGVTLTDKEKQAIGIAKSWQQGEIITMNPVVGVDGSVEYIHGAEQPSVVCAVMQITDIELQRGEAVTSVNLGDSVRWQVQPAVSSGDVTHILVRPRQVGLDTSMVVTTDKRTYHIRLRSHRTEYMPRVRFAYMEEAVGRWEAIRSQAAAKRDKATIPETREYLGDLHFEYTIKGKASWKPVRVYNDSEKTIIEMPDRMRQTEAPVLSVVRKDGRLLKKSEWIMVNYRVHGKRYIVDTVFDQAVMYIGVGGNRDLVTITRKEGGNKK